jgi:hypothetical protein
MEEIKTIEKIILKKINQRYPVLYHPGERESLAKEIYRLILEDRIKTLEEARIIVMKDGDIDFAEFQLKNKIDEINSELEKNLEG